MGRVARGVEFLPKLRSENGRRHAGAGGRIAGNDMNIKQMKFRKIAENTQLKEEEQGAENMSNELKTLTIDGIECYEKEVSYGAR